MRSIYITLLGIFVSLSIFAETSTDTVYTKEWNQYDESWIYFDRIISEYDDNTLSSELIQVFDGIGSWENYSLVGYHYNNGRVIEELEKFWDEKHKTWINSYRKLYSYNGDHVTQILHQYIFQDQYVNSQKEVFTYGENGQLEEKVVEKFEKAWTNFLKYKYIYNAKELILEENLTYWNGECWGDEGFAVKYTYNKNQDLVKKVKTKRNGKKVKNLVLEEFDYGKNGRLNQQIVSEWDRSGKKWVQRNRAEYVNNMNGYVVSALSQNKKRKEWVNHLYTDFRGDNEPITGMDIAGGMTFSIYPINFGKTAMIEFNNPFKEVYFVKVVDQNGQLIGAATTKQDEVSINARKMSKGLYFIELQGRNSYSGKFSIE